MVRDFPTSAYFSLIRDTEVPPEPIFLPFMCRVRDFEVDFHSESARLRDFDKLSFLIRSLCINLTSPAALEHLKFTILFHPISDLIDSHEFYDHIRQADVWNHLDSMITHPISARLQRVEIDVNYTYSYDPEDDDDVFKPNKDDIVDAILRGLPLLREKGILFIQADVWDLSDLFHWDS